ncbi:MAG: DUF975 family protein [Clostridiales bacterium]|nr:DUF975 family protein [Clostridiales bacterium]
MIGKDIKGEARKKLALNMHQAIIVYTVQFTIFITLIALVVMSCVSLGAAVSDIAAIVMICYGSILLIIAIVGAGMINFAMTDFYLVSYRCQPYNVRRLGETIARSNITKVLLMSLKRTLIAFLLLLCLIVPGVIYLMRTSMAAYLLIANPKMKPSAALTASSKVMSGKTGMYFSLCASLIGWYILGIATLGLGFIFISPYINLVKTVFYKRNLQGDKGVYTVSAQTLASMPVTAAQQQGQTRQQQGGQAYSQPAMQQPVGPAPIDALADEDVMDMNAAIQDFGGTDINAAQDRGGNGVDAVPEIPLAAPGSKKAEKQGKTKLTREEKRLAKEAAKQDTHSRNIEGTGLVETERVLTTQELTDSDVLRRKELEHMYSNSERQGPAVNYFDVSGNGGEDDFEDDFGVSPIDEDAVQPEPIIEPIIQSTDDPVIEPIMEPIVEPMADDFAQGDTFDTFDTFETDGQADGAEPIMSESEFDEFLRNFDAVEQEEPSIEQEPLKTEQTANNTDNARQAAADRRRAAEERIERDRRAAADRLANRHPSSPQSIERAERIRREREERLKNQNPKK